MTVLGSQVNRATDSFPDTLANLLLFLLFLASGDVEKDLVRAPGMGRITGSASIETLVRVGIEKENGLAPDSKMVVLHDFTPCVDDELEVKRGHVSNFLRHVLNHCFRKCLHCCLF